MINLILKLMENEVLKTAFLKLANMSIAASWLVLAVLVLRLVLKKAPKWVNVLLWGIVAVRLICPFTIESALSLIPSTQTIPMNIEMAANPAIDSGVPVVNSVVNPMIAASFTPNPAASANPLQIWIPLAAVIWTFGMVLMFLYTAISYWRLNRRIDTAVLYRDNIFQSENVSSPFVLGIINPKIYLPFHMNEQDLQHVVAHEQAHIRRNDHWWKPLGFLLLTVHWFNPLMWLAYVLLCRDIELACDEKVIKELDNEQRANYTQALVASSVNRRMISACPLAFGEVGVKERVKSVMHYKKPTFWIVVLASAACVFVAVFFLTNPKQDSFTLRIVVPAGSKEEFVYSDEEITTIKNSIKIWSGDGLGDTEVLLSPVNEPTETGYTATYLTHGMPVEFDAEEDTWFKVGVNMQNPTDEDIVVYVEVENVEVRISDTSHSVIKWFDYLDNHSEMNDELTLELPEYPGVTFQYTGLQIIASKLFSDSDMTGHTILIDGMPIWNAYITDLTGDGYPDICATYTWGSGIIDSRIVVCDYVNGTSYEISDRGQYDYYLRLNNVDGGLYVDKKLYRSNEILSSARLIFKNGCIQLDGANAVSKTILQAKLIEIHDGYFLVEPVKGSSELSSASRIEVPMKNMEPSPEPQVGDILEIEYDGQLLETYPARISNPYSIKVIEEAESWDRIPMVMVNGELYLDTGKESTVMARCGMMDGEITSQVDGSKAPTMDNQSNFGTGYGYQYGVIEGTIEIKMNGKWWIFATEEVRNDIQFATPETAFKFSFAGNTSGGQRMGLTEDKPYWCITVVNEGANGITIDVEGTIYMVDAGKTGYIYPDKEWDPGIYPISFGTAGGTGMEGYAICSISSAPFFEQGPLANKLTNGERLSEHPLVAYISSEWAIDSNAEDVELPFKHLDIRDDGSGVIDGIEITWEICEKYTSKQSLHIEVLENNEYAVSVVYWRDSQLLQIVDQNDDLLECYYHRIAYATT